MGGGGRMEQSSNPSSDDNGVVTEGVFVEINQRRGMPDFLLMVKLKYVRLGCQYLVQHFLMLLFFSLLVVVVWEVGRIGPEDLKVLRQTLEFNLAHVMSCMGLLVFIGRIYFLSRPRSVYLLDYSCYPLPVSRWVPYAIFMEHSQLFKYFDQKSLDFQMKILEWLGLSEETCLPLALHYISSSPTMAALRDKATRKTSSGISGACQHHLGSRTSHLCPGISENWATDTIVTSLRDSVGPTHHLEETDDFLQVLSPCTRWETAAIGDANMRNIKRGEIIQLERKGYFRCDVPYLRPSKPVVLIAVPD
ncbi:hypothetical protein KI387_012250, partial [Taxus chinensis]